jgi:hypothetical protein
MAFFPPEDNTQDVSGIPINDAMAQLELQRRLKMAQQLQQSKAPEGQMISGHYVAPSWTQSLANAYSVYKGKKAEEEAISKYGEYTKSKETKMADALKKLGSAFEPTTTTSTAMQATEMPLTQGMNVPTSSFGTTDQVNQIAPNYINQAPVQNMTGTTTQMNPVTTTSTTQPTLGGIEKAFGQYATDVNNPKLLEAMLSSRYEKMLKGKEPIKLGAGDVLLGEDYKPLYTAPNKPTAPTIRTMRMGTNEVTQQYDDKTGKWTEISRGPAFKPEEAPKAPAGYVWGKPDANGAPTLIPLTGGPADKSVNPTEQQANAYTFSNRMEKSDQILKDLEGKYNPLAISAKTSAITSNIPGAQTIINAQMSPESQKAEQAQRDFVNAVLRRESGAAISQSEFDNARIQYFPQTGDSPEVKAQKATNRKTAIEGIKKAAGSMNKPAGVVNFEDLK